MRKKRTVILLSCILLLGVCSACHMSTVADPAETESVTQTEEKAAPAEPEDMPVTETEYETELPVKKPEISAVLEETKFSQDWGGDGTLMDFYRWMETEYPEAKAAVARIGRSEGFTGGSPFWEQVESDGYFPFVPEEIGQNSWMQADAAGGQEELWCVIPVDPLSQVILTGPTGVIGEKPEDARIALFYLSAADAENGRQVDVISDAAGEKITFLLNTELNNLPMNGSVVDVTIREGKTPVSLWRLYGWWQADDVCAGEGGQERHLQYRLWFSPDGQYAQFCLENGNVNSRTEGRYWLADGCINMQMSEEEPAFAVPVELKNGSLRMAGDFWQKECDSTPLSFSRHTYFTPRTASTPGYYAPIHTADTLGHIIWGVQAAEEIQTAVVDHLQNGWLVRCFSTDETEYSSLGWWVIQPEGFCYDYLSGEELSLTGLRQEETKGFVRAILEDGNRVSVIFDEDPLVRSYLPEAEIGKAYAVAGLPNRILSIQIEFGRLDYTPYLLLSESNGGGWICNLMQMTPEGEFMAQPLDTDADVLGFETGEICGGEAGPVPTIFAYLEGGILLDVLTGKPADFSPEGCTQTFDPDAFMEEIQEALLCLQSCDRETFGAEVNDSVTYAAGMTVMDGMQRVGILYPQDDPLPEGYDEDPAAVAYYPVTNFRTNAEVWEHLSHYLSEEVIQHVFHNDFLEYDGNLYLSRGGRGYGAIVSEPDTAEYLWEENGRHFVKMDIWAFGSYDHTVRLSVMDTSEGWKIASVTAVEAVG